MMDEKPVVLLVDDNKLLLDMAKTFFKCHGYGVVRTASTFDSALRVFHSHVNDLMVGFIDIDMPGSNDGLDIIQYGHEVVPNRVVLYGWTGRSDRETKRKIWKAGGHGVFIKGFAQEEFEDMEDCTAYPNALTLVQKSYRDFLTGLKNREAFEEDLMLEMEMARIRKSSETFHLIAMDMDNFKGINDNYGHLVGDECLKKVADVIRSVVRKGDHPCRFSGDEFGVCVVGADLHTAVDIANRIEEEVRTTHVPIRGVWVPLSITWGLAQLNHQDIGYPIKDQYLDFRQRADDALYEKKRRRE